MQSTWLILTLTVLKGVKLACVPHDSRVGWPFDQGSALTFKRKLIVRNSVKIALKLNARFSEAHGSQNILG